MFTKNYIHRNSACPQRASPEWPRDQCVETMSSGSRGRPGTLVWVVGQARGLSWCWLGAQPRGWEPKSPSREARPRSQPRQRWDGGWEHSDRPLLRELVSDVRCPGPPGRAQSSVQTSLTLRAAGGRLLSTRKPTQICSLLHAPEML